MRKPYKFKIECPMCEFVAQERTAKETRQKMFDHFFAKSGIHYWGIFHHGCPCCGTFFGNHHAVELHAKENFKAFLLNIRLRMMGITTLEKQ